MFLNTLEFFDHTLTGFNTMLLSCDPGIANFGICLIDNSTHFQVVETHLVKNTRKFTDEEKIVEQSYGPRTVKVQSVISKLTEILTVYPDIEMFIVEAPFYSALTPTSYAALLEVIFAVKYQVILPRNLNFRSIEPLLVKKLFTNNGMASKEAMKIFLKKKKEDGTISIPFEIDDLSEHEIDAVAIGFVHYLSTKDQPPPF